MVAAPPYRTAADQAAAQAFFKVQGLDTEPKAWFREAYEWDRDASKDGEASLPQRPR